jgi:hypothetical protein
LVGYLKTGRGQNSEIVLDRGWEYGNICNMEKPPRAFPPKEWSKKLHIHLENN